MGKRDATQELHSSIDQLRARCQSVQINIRVIRTAEQQSSFTKVDSLVTGLEHQCALGDPEEQGYRKKAESFLNACVSDQVKPGLIDYKFQGMILGCKLEDQKEFRQRLECLVQGRCHMNFLDGMMQQFNIVSSLTSSDCDVISENNQGPNTEVPVESTVVSS
ncbi:BAG family molecular chaperone regulator 2 isoform X2 [Aplysia californica]|uniref:BAG family molecular chaperone regulator 2 isoform X2 n=1 Tax=Aplysia californica TaxID=6500 RepID=A0ABM1VZM6_APLCA|nr:BAG family molecular chaperone regulator 2 isoform X2 [Aplysia californica]